MNPYAIPSLVAAFLAAGVGAYVLYKNPRRTWNRPFALLALAVMLWCFGQFMHRITPGATSLMWYRVSALGWCFIGGIALHFALVFTGREKILENKLVYLVLYGPAFIFLYSAWSTNLIYQLEITEMWWGNTFLPGDLVWTYSLYLFLYVGLGGYFFSRVYRETPVSVERIQSLILIVAFIGPLIISTVTDIVLPWMGIVVMELAAITLAVAIGIIALAILRYKLFRPPITWFFMPTPEAYSGTRLEHELESGEARLVEEKGCKQSAEIFKDQVTHGVPGLWVSSRPSKEIKEEYSLVKTPVIYLTAAMKVSGEITASPSKLDLLKREASNYLSRVRGRSVMLLDCFHQLTLANGFKQAASFLQELGELCHQNNTNLLVPIDSEVFTEEQMTVIKDALKGAGEREKNVAGEAGEPLTESRRWLSALTHSF